MTRRDAASTNGDGRETLVYIPGSASGRVIQHEWQSTNADWTDGDIGH
jgi:hypothetical protein